MMAQRHKRRSNGGSCLGAGMSVFEDSGMLCRLHWVPYRTQPWHVSSLEYLVNSRRWTIVVLKLYHQRGDGPYSKLIWRNITFTWCWNFKLGRCLRHCPSINSTMAQRLVFSGLSHYPVYTRGSGLCIQRPGYSDPHQSWSVLITSYCALIPLRMDVDNASTRPKLKI